MHRFAESEINQCVDVLREFGASKIWLFGGALDSDRPASDLDIACEGISAGRFYDAAGRLLSLLNRPVDLVDVTSDTRLNRHIRSTGRIIFERAESCIRM
jgi:predicted nucleotidyltransferase